MPLALVAKGSLNQLRTISCQFTAPRIYSAIHPVPLSISTKSRMAPRAPWRDILASHLEKAPAHDFSIATVDYDAQGRAVPRVRTCGCRGFFPELELHPKGQQDMDEQVEDGGNPPLYESDMLTFTTDIRMEKLWQLKKSGFDPPIEAMFWLKDSMAQWRVKGRAYALGGPPSALWSPQEEADEELSRRELAQNLRRKTNGSGDPAKWTWDKAVTKYFANHSPIMRGSFRSPRPGQPRSEAPENPAIGMGQKVTDLHDPVARKNFRVVVIEPEEVELLDLTNLEDAKRWKWTLAREDRPENHWVQTELWP